MSEANLKKWQEYFDREALKQAEVVMANRGAKPVLPYVWDKWLESIEDYEGHRITGEKLKEIARGFLLWYDKFSKERRGQSAL